MKKILVLSLCLMALSLQILAQDAVSTEPAPTQKATKSHARPNIPGTFVLEFGLNRATGTPENFNLAFFGSRTLNLYYTYDMRILKSKFSFHPGIGFGFDRYKLKPSSSRAYTVGYDQNGSLVMLTDNDLGISGVKRSQFITNYIDVPLELRFSTNPNDPTRSFKVGIGVRGGYMFDAHTKLKYKDDGTKVTEKVHRDFNLNRFRYGVFAKIGGGNFSIFGYYNLSTLFKSGQGPTTAQGSARDTNNFTIGISLASF